MSYITKEKTTMNKDEKNLITINKDLFAFASTFQDGYFANDLNWKKIAVHFKHETSNQRKIVILMQESEQGWFEASATARTGLWQIEQIQVFDKDGGMVSIPRSDMPTPANFDITTIRKIAPAALVLSIQEGPQKIVLEAGAGLTYKVGFKIRFWDEVAFALLSSTIYTITDITGDIITLDQVVTGYAGKTLRLKFPNFADASAEQKGIYQFIGSNF